MSDYEIKKEEADQLDPIAKDKTITCEDCGNGFVFTAGEQEWFAQKGFQNPKRCKACRDKRKAEWKRREEGR